MPKSRGELLEEAVRYLANHGAGGFSLRQCAEALGTSHRMLAYHFGSKEGLLKAVAEDIGRRGRQLIGQMFDAHDVPSRADLRALLRGGAEGLGAANLQRLLVESAYLRLHDPTYGGYHEVLLAWEPILARLVQIQCPDPERTSRRARLTSAVMLGLAFDYAATDDREGVLQAYEEWFDLVLGPESDQPEDGDPHHLPQRARDEARSVEPVPSS